VLHFNKHEKQRLRKLTAKATGYHGANKATAVTPPAPAATTVPLPATALAAGQQAAPHGFSSNSIELYYCWSHGVSKNSEHTSGSYNSKGEGHQDDASTIDNRKGGINKIVESISHLDRGEGSQRQ
jgi:hypothetical protein